MKIINKQPFAFLQNLTKSMGGVYVDNSKNRKLGRVGRPYDYKKESENKEKTMDKNQVISVLNEDFPYFDGSGTSWELVDENELSGTSRSNYYKTNINGKFYYSLRHGRRGEVSFYLSKEDAINDKECTKEDIIRDIFKDSLVEKTTTLKKAKGPRLDAIIKYSNSDGADGIKISENATDEEKREAIADFYNEAAEGDADNLDEIIEEALEDYVPSK